ncbi:mechanosensitive ion channel family protein [Silvibacterium acidisoli]|uniref:mechanosensitive ion channel family protein n=1 Tax=Acidobacteriaceae bacterium ZG23-2 TaxID=2883246 RepID=UPI00406CA551
MWEQVEQSLRDSMARVTTKVATLLPGILAFVVVLAISVAIAWLLAWVVRRILTAVKFDERISRGNSGISEWAPTYTPTIVITRTVFWGFLIIGLLVGISAFEAASAESGISEYVFTYVPHIIGAAILLLVGNIVARFLSRSVLITAVNLNLHYARLLATGVKWLVMVLTAAMVLDHLSIGGQIVDLAFGILFGGIVLALALAVGLGSRDLVSRSLEKEAVKPIEMPVQEERLRHF